MKRIIALFSTALICLGLSAKGETVLNLIPYPQSVQLGKGSFQVAGVAFNGDPALDSRSREVISQFASRIELVSGKTNSVAFPAGLDAVVAKGKAKGFLFMLDKSLGEEAYTIEITPSKAMVKASAFPGFFYAIQTLYQLLPVQIYGKHPVSEVSWRIPAVIIRDEPRFRHRGFMVDSGRHFFSVDEIKKVIDMMAIYKMNRLHWHLTEDQGWRFESKKYPRLTEIGAFRNGTMIGKDNTTNDGIRYGGYYTQDELRDVVAYAEKKNITIIPEIDLPGHMQAALAAYPNLGCTGGPYEVSTTWGIKKEVLCAGKEATFTFLEDILTELTDIFPSEYIHIGGDECPRQRWKECPDCQQRIAELGIKSDDKHSAEDYLQNYVTARIQAFLNSKGRKIIGWDEILEGKLAEGATVMSWRGVKGGLKAARMGYDVIMSPNTYMYFDYYQSEDKEKEPLAIGHCLPLEKVYSYEPYTDLPAEACPHILGVQANLWTEFIGTNDYLEYMMLPRAAALSEVQWSPAAAKDWESFRVRIKAAPAVYAILGYNFRPLDF